jgi:hypothetical protein
MAIGPDSRCAQALKVAANFARQIVDGTISPYDGANRIASELGECYEFLNTDLEAVDLLAAIAAYADDYQEFQLDAAKVREIESDVVEAATRLTQLPEI